MDTTRAATTDQRRYLLRGAPIIHDTIDNETIAINQLTGAYYSLDGPSALAWQLLAGGTTAVDIADGLAVAYDADRQALAMAVADFIEQLLAEELIVAATGEPAAGDEPVVAGEPAAGDEPVAAVVPAAGERPKPAFAGLELHRYNDLEVLLLADPIHEVDDTGWPKPLAKPGP